MTTGTLTRDRRIKTNEPFAKTHLPCPCGSSSDAYARRADGSGFCYSCSKNFPGEPKAGPSAYDKAQMVDTKTLPFRGISSKTAGLFGVQTKVVDNVEVERGFPYGDKAFKVKRVGDKKEIRIVGDFKDAGLFGQDKFDKGSKDAICITEGEEDAMAAFEMLQGFKDGLGNRKSFACVSIKSGAGSAYRSLVDSYDYVNSFPRIYFCFDNDDRGLEALNSVAGLFDFSKTFAVRMDTRKDGNEYLEAREIDVFQSLVRNAKKFVPDNIISEFSDIEKALDTESEAIICDYPFSGLNEKLYGLHEGEIVVIKGLEGHGKTEMMRAVEFHVIKNTTCPIGLLHFEEDNATTIKKIAGYELEVPATLPDCGLSKQDILAGYRKALKDDAGRVHIHSSFDIEDESSVYGSIRFLAAATGCRVVFLDHITWMATGQEGDEDERRKLDRISQKLKLLAKELRICIVEISHVNDDGKTRGSRNITKVANTVIHVSRDVQAEDAPSTFTIEKNRNYSRAGAAGYGYYNRMKGVLKNEPEMESL